MVRRRIFADMSSDELDGVPDGMKVDVEGRVYCTGPGGTWVFASDGARLGIIRTPEIPANLAFGVRISGHCSSPPAPRSTRCASGCRGNRTPGIGSGGGDGGPG